MPAVTGVPRRRPVRLDAEAQGRPRSILWARSAHEEKVGVASVVAVGTALQRDLPDLAFWADRSSLLESSFHAGSLDCGVGGEWRGEAGLTSELFL